MALLDLFRTQPEWKHADPEVRASAVRRLPASDQKALADIARADEDARVRRAAISRLGDPATLVEIARDEEDTAVLRTVDETLLELALRASEAAVGEQALAGLQDIRALVTVARQAQRTDIRRAALARLPDDRSRGAVVRGSEDPALRLEALESISDAEMLLEVALKSEHKATAVAAVDRLHEQEQLQAVAGRARHRAAVRRARARLEAEAGDHTPAHPVADGDGDGDGDGDDAEDLERWNAAQAAERQRQEEDQHRREQHNQALAERVALCDRIEGLEGDDAETQLDAAQREWEALAPLADPEPDELRDRHQAVVAAARQRIANQEIIEQHRAEVDELCVAADKLAEQEDLDAARSGRAELDAHFQKLVALGAGAGAQRRRFAAADERLKQRLAEAADARQKTRAENKTRIKTLCDELEALAKATDLSLKACDQKLREARRILDEHNPLAEREHGTLLERLKAARSRLYPRVQELRDDFEWKRWANSGAREELCRQVETLAAAENPDLDKADRELKHIDAQWRQAGGSRTEDADAVRQRYLAARGPLRERCDAFLKARVAEGQENLEKKKALCTRAEALAESTEWLKTAEQLQKLQAEWKTIGPVPHRQAKAIWQRFRKPCDQFFKRRKTDLENRKKVWSDNLKAKQALIAQAETLAESTDWDASVREFKRLQGEWKTIGAVRKNQSEAVWKRFRAACDAFFTRYKQRDQIEAQAAIATREALCAEMEGWLPGVEEAAPEDPHALFQTLHKRWRQAPVLPRSPQSALTERFNKARDALVEAYPDRFKGTDLDPEAGRARRQKLVVRAEQLCSQVESTGVAAGASVAEQLRNALAANALGGKAAEEERLRAAGEELESLRAAWRRSGPTGGEAGRELSQRFEDACRRARQRIQRS